MSKEIVHFMWGYQPHFRSVTKSRALQALGELDVRLDPRVFIVGIRPGADGAPFPACVEPEHGHWAKSSDFDGVWDRAKELAGTYPEAEMFQSHPLAAERHEDRLIRRGIQDAVIATINEHEETPTGREFFASWPVDIGGYWVCVVLHVDSSPLNERARLTTDRAHLHPYRTFPVARSLIDAVVTELLSDAEQELHMPEPGNRPALRLPEEVLRAAARRLANDCVFRADTNAIEGHHSLFETVCAISTMTYEREESAGLFVLAKSDHPGLSRKLTLSEPPRLREHRRCRKLLELSSDTRALHVNGERLFGLSELTEDAFSAEDLFEVRILGRHRWRLLHDGGVLMTVTYGLPRLPPFVRFDERLRVDLPRLFHGITNEDVDRVVALVEVAERERHGTLLVICDHAESEAARLHRQSTTIEPVALTPDLLAELTGIDGAVLLHPDGTGHAIGVILDGVASESGNPARGARYNSALRYVEYCESRKFKALAVIVSEDGGVDLYPALRPPVPRSLIESLLQDLTNIYDAERLAYERYSETLGTLKRFSFYMLPDDCALANDLVERLDARSDAERDSNIYPVRTPFEPDPSFAPALHYSTTLQPPPVRSIASALDRQIKGDLRGG